MTESNKQNRFIELRMVLFQNINSALVTRNSVLAISVLQPERVLGLVLGQLLVPELAHLPEVQPDRLALVLPLLGLDVIRTVSFEHRKDNPRQQ
jgi:hypothetical protein